MKQLRRIADVRLSRVVMTAAPRVTQDKSRGNLITIAPATDELHSATFVGPIHGLGDTNMGWADLAVQLIGRVPHVKFVLPNAPIAPVTLNGGMAMPSWYDITSLDDRSNQPCTGIEDSQAAIQALIDEEVASGIPLDRIVVGGFSQGGAMAIATGLQYSGTLAGVCVLSGYLAKAESFKLSPEAAKTPVAHFHGTIDPVVKIEWARETASVLKEMGCVEYELKEYPDVPHSASMEELEDLAEWLMKRLPPV
jgi:predicted esterase